MRRGLALLIAVLCATLSLALPAFASDGSGDKSKKHATVTLTIAPTGSVPRGTAIVMTATVKPGTSRGVVRFYDGAHLLYQKPHISSKPVMFSTRALKTGAHRLRVVFGRGRPFHVVAVSSWVPIVLAAVPTIDDQNLVARIPPHKLPIRVKPGTNGRPPHVKPPQGVSGNGQGRGGLAYTGVALLGLLLLAATLLATGSAAWWAGRDRARRTVRLVGALLTIVGGIGVGVVYVGGGGMSQAQPGLGYPTALPADAPDRTTLMPAWPSGQPRGTLSVLGPSGNPLVEPIQVEPGQQLTVVASGFAADDGVLAQPSDAGPASEQLQADSTGTVRFLIVIPREVTPGLHTISLAGSRLTAGVAFTVTGRAR